MLKRSLPLSALLLALLALPAHGADQAAAQPKPGKTVADVLKASSPSDWRPLDPQNTLYLELASGRVIIELAPQFAPNHVANIKALVRENYFDNLPIIRAQDNYVVQWGDPEEDPAKARPIKTAKATLHEEFAAPVRKDMSFTALPDIDTYAPHVGFTGPFPSARDAEGSTTWLAHCYGMVGAGRDVDADSGGGTQLYVVIGNAPRQLDRNVTLVGRVMQGMELLSTLPRGTGAMGFYEKPEQYTPIKSVRIEADLPASERAHLETLRTDTPTFQAVVDAVRSRSVRHEDWYKYSPERVELCNVPVAVRKQP